MPPDFRERVTLELLMDRVVPPYRPPEVKLSNIATVAGVFVALCGIFAWVFFEIDMVLPGVGLVVLGVVPIAMAVVVARHRMSLREFYITLHGQTKDRAWRMLNGQGSRKYDDTESRLRADAEALLNMQEPPPRGSTVWVFVWWEG